MAAINTIVQTTKYADKTQMFLRSNLVAGEICGSKFPDLLRPGRTVDFPYATQSRVQNYTFSTDATIDGNTWTSNTYAIDQLKIATANFDPFQTMQGHQLDTESAIWSEIGYELSRNVDQYVFSIGVARATSTAAGGTLSASNMFEYLADVTATLARGRARAGTRCVVLDPERVSVLAKVNKANGFNLADATLKSGFVGTTEAGFEVYVSNDLPSTVTFTVTTIPTAGDTFTVGGVTFTAAAAGAATAAGEYSIGVNAAAAQVNIALAIQGTGTPGATTYIDVSTINRRTLQGMQFAVSAWVANVATITAYGKINASETHTPADNVFGTESTSSIATVKGMIDLTMQKAPNIIVRDETKNASHNVMGIESYGADLFFYDRPSVVKLTWNT